VYFLWTRDGVSVSFSFDTDFRIPPPPPKRRKTNDYNVSDTEVTPIKTCTPSRTPLSDKKQNQADQDDITLDSLTVKLNFFDWSWEYSLDTMTFSLKLPEYFRSFKIEIFRVGFPSQYFRKVKTDAYRFMLGAKNFHMEKAARWEGRNFELMHLIVLWVGNEIVGGLSMTTNMYNRSKQFHVEVKYVLIAESLQSKGLGLLIWGVCRKYCDHQCPEGYSLYLELTAADGAHEHWKRQSFTLKDPSRSDKWYELLEYDQSKTDDTIQLAIDIVKRKFNL